MEYSTGILPLKAGAGALWPIQQVTSVVGYATRCQDSV
jgi:hypothetical protein